VVWRLSGKDITKFDQIFRMPGREFLNYAMLHHDILKAEEMERMKIRNQMKSREGR
jgi:hypothetical protein